jgi:HEAT repeat protein
MSENTIENLITQAETSINSNNWDLALISLQQLSQQLLSPQTEEQLTAVLNLAIQVLENSDFATRWDLAKLFPLLGKRAIAPLLEIIENEDLDTEYRWFVARILAGFPASSVIPTLAQVLQQTTDEELRAIASQSLASFGSDAINTLSDLLTNSETRLLATQALSEINSQLTIAPLLTVIHDADPQVRQRAIASLINYPDPRIPPILIEAVNDLSSLVRKEAITGISLYIQQLSVNTDLISLLKPLLSDINLDVCCQTIICLGKIATPEAMQLLYELLLKLNTPAELKLEIIRTFGRIPNKAALDYLEDALYVYTDPDNTSDHLLLKEIINSFGQVHLPNLQAIATNILLRFVQSDHPALLQSEIRQSLVLAWGYLGDVKTIDYLILFLADENARVRLHCLAALKKLDGDLAYEKLTTLAQEPDLMPELQNGIAIALREWEKTETQSGL